jgi:hypothetical protein
MKGLGKFTIFRQILRHFGKIVVSTLLLGDVKIEMMNFFHKGSIFFAKMFYNLSCFLVHIYLFNSIAWRSALQETRCKGLQGEVKGILPDLPKRTPRGHYFIFA